MVTQSSTFVWLLHTDWEAMFWPMNPMNPLNPKALRKCPAFDFASISSSTRASSTRTWSGALICQTRYFFQKYENRTCINLQNHLLMILMSWFIGCFTSLRLDDAGPPSYGKSKNHGCINLYELTTMPQSGIWSLSWTKLAYKIYTLYKSLSIKNQLLTSLHTCYQPTIFSPSSSLTCARSMLLMVSASPSTTKGRAFSTNPGVIRVKWLSSIVVFHIHPMISSVCKLWHWKRVYHHLPSSTIIYHHFTKDVNIHRCRRRASGGGSSPALEGRSNVSRASKARRWSASGTGCLAWLPGLTSWMILWYIYIIYNIYNI